MFCRKRCVSIAHSWAIFGFVVLSISITLISLVVIWDQIKQMQRKTETLDFVLFGPKRDVSGSLHREIFAPNDTRVLGDLDFSSFCGYPYFVFLDIIKVSEYRALTYALAHNASNVVNKSAFSANEFFETYQHVEKNYSLICYYVTPSRSSPQDRLQPYDIDPHLCSHIIIFFASIEDSRINFTDTEVGFYFCKIRNTDV